MVHLLLQLRTDNEKEVLEKTFLQLIEINVLSSESSLSGFYDYYENISEISFKCPRLEKNHRDLVMLIKYMAVYFYSSARDINNYENQYGDSFKNSEVISRLNQEIYMMIKSIIMLEECDMKIPSLVLVRSLIELSWILLVSLIDEKARTLSIDDSIPSIKKWNKYFKPKILKEKIEEYEKTLDINKDMLDFLREKRSFIYKKYSDLAYFDYLSVEKKSVEAVRYPKGDTNCMDQGDITIIAETLYFAMLMQRYIITRGKRFKISKPGVHSIEASVMYALSQEVGVIYLDASNEDIR